jgi:hypothetical protein
MGTEHKFRWIHFEEKEKAKMMEIIGDTRIFCKVHVQHVLLSILNLEKTNLTCYNNARDEAKMSSLFRTPSR